MKAPPPAIATSDRSNALMWLAVGSFALLAFSHIRLLRRVDALLKERELIRAELQSDQNVASGSRENSNQPGQPAAPETSFARPTSFPPAPEFGAPAAQNRLAALERRIEELTQPTQRVAGVRAVAEYNVLNPSNPVEAPPGDPEPPPRRNWGHEQATGPPDTAQASDAVTAWA